jgi:hypothetical protein
MVTDKKIYNSALTRYRFGNVLIWLGVLVWAPFIVLRIAGEQPSMSWYLPLHLLGVIGGSRLRAGCGRVQIAQYAPGPGHHHLCQWDV